MYAFRKTQVAVDSIYGFQPTNKPTFDEAVRIFAPVRANIDALRDEVITVRGYPAFVDHTGQLSRIDHAMLGWIEIWEKLAPDIDQRALRKLHRKLLNGIAIEEAELDAALAELDRQQARFLITPTDTILGRATDQLITIELDRLGIRKDVQWPR